MGTPEEVVPILSINIERRRLRMSRALIERPYETIASNVTASTATYAVIGSVIDARTASSLALTVVNASQTISFKVEAANQPDFDDVVEAKAEADILAGAVGTYAVAPAPYAYYRVQIKDKVSGTHGSAVLTAIVKG